MVDNCGKVVDMKTFTDPQRELIGTLLGERIITKPVHTELAAMIEGMRTTKDASKIINKLIKQPRKDPRKWLNR